MLAALAVIVLPLLLHFVNRAFARPRAWGAMMFLRESSDAHRRGVPRQWWLLLSRMGLLATLALVFAGPVHFNHPGTGVELVIVVDTSASMGKIDAGIGRMDRAKSAALRALSTLKSTDLAALVTPGLTIRPTRDLQSLAARIGELSPSSRATAPGPELKTAVGMLGAASPRMAQCCIIGDLSNPRWMRSLSKISPNGGTNIVMLNVGRASTDDRRSTKRIGKPARRRKTPTVHVTDVDSAESLTHALLASRPALADEYPLVMAFAILLLAVCIWLESPPREREY